ERRNAWRAKLAEHRAQLHRGANAAEGARGVANDGRWPPEILFQEVIQQIGERRGNAVVVLSADDDERIGRTDPCGQPFEDLRRLALLVFLVHFLQQGELVLQRVDQRRLVPARLAGLDEKSRRLDALAVRADGAVDDEEIECVGHEPYPFTKTDFDALEVPRRTSSHWSGCRPAWRRWSLTRPRPRGSFLRSLISCDGEQPSARAARFGSLPVSASTSRASASRAGKLSCSGLITIRPPRQRRCQRSLGPEGDGSSVPNLRRISRA